MLHFIQSNFLVTAYWIGVSSNIVAAAILAPWLILHFKKWFKGELHKHHIKLLEHINAADEKNTRNDAGGIAQSIAENTKTSGK